MLAMKRFYYILVLTGFVVTASILDSITLCKGNTNMNSCVLTSSRDVLRMAFAGIPELKIPAVSNILIPFVPLGCKENCSIELYNLHAVGCEHGDVQDVLWFSEKRHAKFNFSLSDVTYIFDYNLDCNVNGSHITGVGRGNFFFDYGWLKCDMDFAPDRKFYGEFTKLSYTDCSLGVHKLTYKFQNVTDQYNTTTEDLNVLINNNWEFLYNCFNGDIAKLIQTCLEGISGRILSIIPFSGVF